MKILARAKINWHLNVLYKRPDGFHELESIMQTLKLADVVEVKPTAGLSLTCSDPAIPLGDGTLATRAAKAFCEHFKIEPNFSIHIEKNIPTAAGLAGGSSDGAAVLMALQALTGLGTGDELMAIAATIGSDVPYCLYGGTAICRGRGEKVEDFDSRFNRHVVLLRPGVEVTTAGVYGAYRPDKIRFRGDTLALKDALAVDDFAGVKANLTNDLATVTEAMHPIIPEIREKFMALGAEAALMSGSGPTVFALFKEKAAAGNAAAALKELGAIRVTETDNRRGPMIVEN